MAGAGGSSKLGEAMPQRHNPSEGHSQGFLGAQRLCRGGGRYPGLVVLGRPAVGDTAAQVQSKGRPGCRMQGYKQHPGSMGKSFSFQRQPGGAESRRRLDFLLTKEGELRALQFSAGEGSWVSHGLWRGL